MADTIVLSTQAPISNIIASSVQGPMGVVDPTLLIAETNARIAADNLLAPIATTYTKTEVDTALSLKITNKTYKEVNINYTVLNSDDIIVVKAPVSITLPNAATFLKQLTIKNGGVGTVTLLPISLQTIDSYLNLQITETNSSVDLMSTGSNWVII